MWRSTFASATISIRSNICLRTYQGSIQTHSDKLCITKPADVEPNSPSLIRLMGKVDVLLRPWSGYKPSKNHFLISCISSELPYKQKFTVYQMLKYSGRKYWFWGRYPLSLLDCFLFSDTGKDFGNEFVILLFLFNCRTAFNPVIWRPFTSFRW